MSGKVERKARAGKAPAYFFTADEETDARIARIRGADPYSSMSLSAVCRYIVKRGLDAIEKEAGR